MGDKEHRGFCTVANQQAFSVGDKKIIIIFFKFDPTVTGKPKICSSLALW